LSPYISSAPPATLVGHRALDRGGVLYLAKEVLIPVAVAILLFVPARAGGAAPRGLEARRTPPR